jgi:hypothetical protein
VLPVIRLQLLAGALLLVINLSGGLQLLGFWWQTEVLALRLCYPSVQLVFNLGFYFRTQTNESR